MNDLPSALLITEAAFSKNAGGISQTLYNLFEGYPKQKLAILCSEEDTLSWAGKEETDFTILTFSKSKIKGWTNRLGLLINPLLGYVNLSLIGIEEQTKEKVKIFKPEVIVLCANGIEGIVIGQKIIEEYKVPYLVYFMDDWFYGRKETWWKGSLQKAVQNLLEKANAWIMISTYLQKTLEERYGIEGKKSLIAHNPVSVWQKEQTLGQKAQKGIRIAYAGSLWPMHLDAFRIFAQACRKLREKGVDVEFHMFGNTVFYENNKVLFQEEGVVYKGKVAYEQLYDSLFEYDFLLVCSSFEQEHAPFSRSSVQTKITDYLNVGKPILSVGPSYGACNLYLQQHQVGYTFDKHDPDLLATFLERIHKEEKQTEAYVQKGKQLIKEKCSKEKVQKELYEFIAETLTSQ